MTSTELSPHQPAGSPTAPSTSHNPVVVFDGVSRAFGTTLALNNVSFSIPAGSVCALLGPNGAGKTTALRILLGLARPNSGTVRILGEEPGTTWVRQRLGYLPDVPTFPNWLNASEYLYEVASLEGLSASQARTRVPLLLDLTSLQTSQRIGGYSRGMRQRLGLAQALISSPDVLVLDEPTSALDPSGRRAVLDLLHELGKHATVIISSHNLSEIQEICTHAVLLKDGNVLAASTLEELMSTAGAGFMRVRVDHPDAFAAAVRGEPWCASARVEGLDVIVRGDEQLAGVQIPRIITQLGERLHAYSPSALTLEEVFLTLTSEEGQ